MDVVDFLFFHDDLDSVFAHQVEDLREHVNKLSEDYILGASESDLIAHLKDKYSIEPIALGEPFVASSDEVDIEDPARHTFRGGPVYAKGMRIHVKVPYTGDRNLFWFEPTVKKLRIETNDHLDFYYMGEHLLPENVKRDLDVTLGEIRDYVNRLTVACSTHNGSLESKIREMLKERKERLMSNKQIVESLGLQIQERSDASRTYSVPDVQRKPEIRAPVVKEKAFIPEPALDQKEYKHILSIIRSMVSVIERSPKEFAHIGEEGLRSHFLVQLNGQYQGRATGETFNYDGKTDILIREGDRNVFIAECKIWKGETELLKAVDQILAYLHWRDTKAALLVFNRNKGFSDVLSKIAAAIQRHPNCKKLIKIEGETEWRFLFSSKDDANRELQLAVLAFDVPRGSK